jgi:hypothetical protein
MMITVDVCSVVVTLPLKVVSRTATVTAHGVRTFMAGPLTHGM